jgi:TPP-dependent 2-oxoacid decarboxylase
VLSLEAQERLQSSINAVRKQARKMVQAGETAAIEIDQSLFATLEQSRTAFLELDAPLADATAPEAEGRGVDFDAPTLPPMSDDEMATLKYQAQTLD